MREQNQKLTNDINTLKSDIEDKQQENTQQNDKIVSYKQKKNGIS